MGARASAALKPGTMGWTAYEQEQQVQLLKFRYETELEIHSMERKHVAEHHSEIRTNMETLEETNMTSKKSWESEIRKERENHNEEKNVLGSRIDELQKELQSVKENLEGQMKNQEKKHHKTLRLYTWEKRQLKKELDAVKIANMKLQMEKEDLMKQNEELKKKLEAVTTTVRASSSWLAGRRSGPQGHLCLKEADPLDCFQPVRVLGQGAFGKVVLAKKKAPDGPEQLFAIKALINPKLIDNEQQASVFTEKEVMILASDHPCIATLHSCFRAKGNLFFVMAYESGGTLLSHLKKEGVFSERTVQFYTAEITLALEFLHKHGILHRDLKLQNILIGGDGHCKVADFGLSKLGIFPGDRTSGSVGTRYYMAPEMVQGMQYGHEIDWWAVGIMMYTMLMGRLPFCEPDKRLLREKIKKLQVEFPAGISKSAQAIMRKLLAKDPTKRLGTYHRTEKVREQPFFKGIDWSALQKKRMEPPIRIKVVQETQETLTFDDLFKHNNETAMNSQGEFEGFSHAIHRVKRR